MIKIFVPSKGWIELSNSIETIFETNLEYKSTGYEDSIELYYNISEKYSEIFRNWIKIRNFGYSNVNNSEREYLHI